MAAKRKSWVSLVAVIIVSAIGVFTQQRQEAAPERADTGRVERQAPAPIERDRDAARVILDDVTVLNYGKPFYRGSVDLTETIARIRAGRKHRHRNDGAVFGNREGRLPRKPRGYYREYVHPTPGLSGAGPQRLVVGQEGEWYYTADHYATFKRVEVPSG